MAANGYFSWRISFAMALAAARIAAILAFSFALTGPAPAQFFDERFPFVQQRRQWNPFFSPPPQERAAPPPVDYSRAPPPRKVEGNPTSTIMVFGDSMADWFAYGLELAFAESPEMGVMRKHRTWSGLIRQDMRHDPRGEYPDWPKMARETLTAEKPDFIVMMIGLNDRRQIREVRPPPRPASPKPAQRAPEQSEQGKQAAAPTTPETEQKNKQPSAATTEQPPSETPAPAPPAAQSAAVVGPFEFRTEKWAELYVKRIDEMIAALKSKGAPIFWVGMPPVRGTRSMADFAYVNDLFRGRAAKAGIVYVDVWDGFVDESGRFVEHGPDVDGQIRRLRTSDGVHFTKAGARKLAHYFERELQRWITARAAPVALPAPEEAAPKTPEARPGSPGAATARPLSGPVVPLTGPANDSDELLGGGRRESAADAIATRVLVKGEPLPAAAGRADDFAWPRRGVAPLGSDPVVATTTLPMTPMRAERPADAPATAESTAGPAGAHPQAPGAAVVAGRNGPRRPAQPQTPSRPEPRQVPFSFFPFLFGR